MIAKGLKLLIVGIISFFAIYAFSIPGAAANSNTAKKPALRALIITPQPESEPALGIVKLLNSHGIKTTSITPQKADTKTVSAYDVLVVTGKDRRLDKTDGLVEYSKPVLAVGPYGCRYLGLFKLKNGYPYT